MLFNADIVFKNNKFILSGELDFTNVMSLYEKSLLQLATCPALEFDFSAVKSSDSAGLALIIEWLKFAKRHGKPIQFINLSNELQSLAKAAGVNQLVNPK